MPFVIDVDPVAFAPLGIPVRWYALILIVALGVAWWIARRGARRHAIPDATTDDAIIWVAVAGLAGSRLLYVLQNELGAVAADPAHALMVWQGGLSFYGGLVAALAVLGVFARRRRLSLLVAADVAAPAAALGQAIGHLGCLIGGDSYGIATSVPWAIVYRNPGAMAPLGVPLHPTQVYEALALVALFAALSIRRDRLERLGAGAAAAVYLVGLAAIRFGLFFLRDEAAVLLGLKTAQWIGLGIGIAGLVLLVAVVLRRRAVLVPAAMP